MVESHLNSLNFVLPEEKKDDPQEESIPTPSSSENPDAKTAKKLSQTMSQKDVVSPENASSISLLKSKLSVQLAVMEAANEIIYSHFLRLSMDQINILLGALKVAYTKSRLTTSDPVLSYKLTKSSIFFYFFF